MPSHKTPTEMLKEDHQHVLKKLDALEEITHHLDKKGEVSAKLKDLAAFFKTEFWVHFTKEEEALFPEIDKFIPRESGPIGVMLIEHEDLRKTNSQLQPAIAAYLRDSDNAEARGVIQRDGAHFVELLRNHIDKEDNILFMMADMHLNQAKIDKVAKLFAKIEGAGG